MDPIIPQFYLLRIQTKRTCITIVCGSGMRNVGVLFKKKKRWHANHKDDVNILSKTLYQLGKDLIK